MFASLVVFSRRKCKTGRYNHGVFAPSVTHLLAWRKLNEAHHASGIHQTWS
jgi:hypothetical protein